jgi:hypothetical protein
MNLLHNAQWNELERSLAEWDQLTQWNPGKPADPDKMRRLRHKILDLEARIEPTERAEK